MWLSRSRRPPSHRSAGSQLGSTEVVAPWARTRSNSAGSSGARRSCRKYELTCTCRARSRRARVDQLRSAGPRSSRAWVRIARSFGRARTTVTPVGLVLVDDEPADVHPAALELLAQETTEVGRRPRRRRTRRGARARPRRPRRSLRSRRRSAAPRRRAARPVRTRARRPPSARGRGSRRRARGDRTGRTRPDDTGGRSTVAPRCPATMPRTRGEGMAADGRRDRSSEVRTRARSRARPGTDRRGRRDHHHAARARDPRPRAVQRRVAQRRPCRRSGPRSSRSSSASSWSRSRGPATETCSR